MKPDITQDEQLALNIGAAISKCKRDGTTAMGMANLKQITPTNRLTMTTAYFHSQFERIAKAVAKRRRFPILADRADCNSYCNNKNGET